MLQIRVFRPPSTSWHFFKTIPNLAYISFKGPLYQSCAIRCSLQYHRWPIQLFACTAQGNICIRGCADEECSVVRNPRNRTFRHCQCAGNLNLKEEEKHPEPSPTYDSMILWSETLPSKNRTFRHCHRALNPTPTPLSSCREPNITLINLDGDRNHHCWTNLEHSWGIMIQQPTRNFTNPIRTR